MVYSYETSRTGQKESCFYAGTKSEHEGLVLITAAGEFKLQLKGGNPFWDEKLAALQGKEIEAEGTMRETRFIMSQWIVLP